VQANETYTHPFVSVKQNRDGQVSHLTLAFDFEATYSVYFTGSGKGGPGAILRGRLGGRPHSKVPL